jgi:hypothetical protein
MKQDLSCEDDSLSDGQEIPSSLDHKKVCYHTQNSLSYDPFQSRKNPIHPLKPHIFNITFNIILQSRSRSLIIKLPIKQFLSIQLSVPSLFDSN